MWIGPHTLNSKEKLFCCLCNSLQRLNISSTHKTYKIIQFFNKTFYSQFTGSYFIATQMNMWVIYYYNLNEIEINLLVQMFLFLFGRIWKWLLSTKTTIITMKPTLPFLIIKTIQIIYLINPRPSLISPHHLKGDLTKSDKCNQFYEELEDWQKNIMWGNERINNSLIANVFHRHSSDYIISLDKAGIPPK